MRPPRCDVCCEPAADDGLVQCRSTPDDLEWHHRAQEPGFVGHPPDTGWFCGEHVVLARQLAALHPLAGVLSALRPASETHHLEASAGTQDTQDRSIVDLHARLVTLLPELVRDARLSSADVTVSTSREWEPMDGAQPPWCPFRDTTLHTLEGAKRSAHVRREVAHWSDEEPARTWVTLTVVEGGAEALAVSVWSPAANAPTVIEACRVRGDLTPELVEALEGIRRQ